jgi:2-dehydro-3-deoxygluconokinase
VGGGDSFGGGLIHAMLKWPGDHQKAIDFAVAASCLKHTIEFDFNMMSESEVLALAGGNASGRVQR